MDQVGRARLAEQAARGRGRTMTEAELRDAPVSLPVVEAGRAFGLSRKGTYELLKAGKFPCRTVQVGRAKRVPRAELLRVLGLDPEIESAAG